MEGVLIPWSIAATLLLFVAAYWLYSLERRLAAMDKQYEDLKSLEVEEDIAIELLQRAQDHGDRLDHLEGAVVQIGQRLPHVIDGLGVMRYNAFDGVGGAQSFSVALTDETGHGVIITSLYGRGDVRVYAKSIENWKSSRSLSAEEQKALGMARQGAGMGSVD